MSTNKLIFFFLRNILYIPDSYSSHQHNLIIWNLFQQNLDQVAGSSVYSSSFQSF